MTADGYSGALGVLGGMGPSASAGFLQTVYEAAAEQSGSFAEQTLPRCLLDSDPAFPDRTEVIRTGGEVEFTARLARRLAGLEELGATRIVVACVTAHHFLDRLEPARRTRLISLVDVILDELEAVGAGERLLLVASHGTRDARVFERTTRWPTVAHRVVLPGPEVQETLHQLLYRLKSEPATDEISTRFLRIAAEHGCRGLIAGCTEAHLLTRRLRGGEHRIIDPLLTIATQLKSLLAE
ncbi:aspartate/glutamate racemase family protein [Micromonospora sp. LH3U1]|uniref:aspartate/glutamate racemase family protein n=1 Tax=Micromonospora sp. LH3U1 TaxID=3018339 RepID=UPI00234B5D69|nr:aspartate/glutamate racemase family protein [Micromonospora sp. LH3U1]WCN79527.1 aspartate/glutamate racemase family protein [Micromonospora sp. LH3U1]